MKKNLRIISVAAAALLAVAPVVSTAIPVNADTAVNVGSSTGTGANTTNTNTQAPQNKPYFTYNNEIIGESTQSNPLGNVVRTTVSFKSGDKVSDLISKISKAVQFHKDNYAGGENVTINEQDFINQLKNNGVTTKTINPSKKGEKSYEEIDKVPSTSFNITLSASANNQTATIQIPMVPEGASAPVDTTQNPQINWTKGGQAQSASLNGQVFQVAVGSSFNPLSFTNSNGDTISISAQQSKDNSTYASIEATSNPVNTSEAGRYYNVTLTATGNTGKKTTATYTVLITSSQKQTLYANGSNMWVKTSALVKPAGDTNVKTYPVMIDSRAYDKNGNYLGHMYYAYDNIDVVPTVVTINGKTYYKVANKDEYVRVTNITGNKRTLTHNAYIYWSSYRRTPGTGKMYKGQTVTTYGPAMRFKNGKKYYRIEGCRNNNKRYIKAANLSAAQ